MSKHPFVAYHLLGFRIAASRQVALSMLFLLASSIKGGLAFSQVVSTSSSSLGQDASPTSLRWYAKVAKERGQSSLKIGTNETNDYSPALDESLRHDLVVKGVVVSHLTDYSDGHTIYQWYTVKVASQGPSRSFIANPEHVSLPSSIKKTAPDEILVRVQGGSALVDGVNITQLGPPSLTDGHQYLFFLNKTLSGFYTLGFETTVVPVDARGTLDVSSLGSKRFSSQLRAYHSYDDIQRLALRTHQ